MEYKQFIAPVFRPWLDLPRPKILAVLIAGIFCLSVTSLAADTYRWKDKDGKLHYGAMVPAEYADQPHDILNSSGVVIEHVEDTSIPPEVKVEEEEEVKEDKTAIEDERRQRQADRLLLVRYPSEEAILEALDVEVKQLGYDQKLIDQSSSSTNTAIRQQIRQAADQQRANIPISESQQKNINKLYARRSQDEKRVLSMNKRELLIRARFRVSLERYRFLQLKASAEEIDAEQADQG